jgi:FAD/FMN-containing dehydrogenase
MTHKHFIENWGRLGSNAHDVITLEQILNKQLGGSYLSVGNGRSYGDVGFNSDGLVHLSSRSNNFVRFDPDAGILCAEAGVLLGTIQHLFAPRGWMLPVTPGTQFVTLAGALANDVHGKNHHSQGSFGHHVKSIQLYRSDLGVIDCSINHNTELFHATIGGLGLTGIILSAELKLKRVSGPWLDCEAHPFGNLGEFFALSRDFDDKYEYSVSWVDSTSKRKRTRGWSFFANHSKYDGELQPKKMKTFPFDPPFSLINRTTTNLFNRIYFQSQKKKPTSYRVDFDTYFYPLDALKNWNKIYGKKGFYQYQSVIPTANAEDATQEMFDKIAESDQGSFLMVLKTFGELENCGMLSFPLPGVTLAMDFPNRGQDTLKLFDTLDTIVTSAGGRLYPAKDHRMSQDVFLNGYQNIDQFQLHRDPSISSNMSRRLLGK